MPTLSAFSRSALLAGLTLAALAAPAQAQVFGGAPASDVQALNLAGGGTYVEGYWLPYTYSRDSVTIPAGATFTADDGTTVGGGSQAGAEVEGRARPSFGAEGRFVVPTAPWLFGTAEYRYEQFDRGSVYAGTLSTGFQDIGRQHLQIFRVGAGVRAPGTPFYTRAEYANIRLNGDGDNGSSHDNGYAIHGGFSQPLTNFLGVRAEAGYQDFGDLGHGFTWQAGGNLNLTPAVALTGGYRSTQLRDGSGSDRTGVRLQEVTVGLRFQFSQ